MESRLTVKFQMVISLIEKDLSFYIVSIYKYTIVGELYAPRRISSRVTSATSIGLYGTASGI